MYSLSHLRKEYKQQELTRESLDKDPVEQFRLWFNEASEAAIEEPNAMVLSTVGRDLRPSSRIVLLKDFSEPGFAFFTNFDSRKGKDLEANPFASLLFPWHRMERQIRIEGSVQKVTDKESDSYFSERPEGSQIGAWISPQSTEISSREYLDDIEIKIKERFHGQRIPRPVNWGGYRLVPNRFEFWQGRENRLHDRFEYSLVKAEWKIRRLAP